MAYVRFSAHQLDVAIRSKLWEIEWGWTGLPSVLVNIQSSDSTPPASCSARCQSRQRTTSLWSRRHPPSEVIGKPLGETGIRSRHGVTVVAVKHKGSSFTYATEETVLQRGM